MLAEHFGSINALLNATMDELTSIEGIGTDTAETILKALQSPQFMSSSTSSKLWTKNGARINRRAS